MHFGVKIRQVKRAKYSGAESVWWRINNDPVVYMNANTCLQYFKVLLPLNEGI